MTTPAAPPPRSCPLCGGRPDGLGFPYASQWAGREYRYLACADCGTRYIDPPPGPDVLAQIYAPEVYHASFYADDGHADYSRTAKAIAGSLPSGAKVLDFGCGAGHLLAALRAEGLDAHGGEYTADGAANAALRSGCPVHDLSSEAWIAAGPWDAIHLGDVIEHMAEPRAELGRILAQIRPGGVLSAEGPLEAQASLVNLAARGFGWLKRTVRPNAVAAFPPYHLLFTTAAAQRALFGRLGRRLDELVFEVSENGWPYRGNGRARDLIARAGIALSRLPLARGRLGNRFRALYRVAG